jgi:hypothetical protein
MDLGIFTPSRPYIENASDEQLYGMPPPAERRSAPLFWGWVQGMFSGEQLPEPADDGADWRIQAMRRREARIAEANNAVPPTISAADLVREAVTHVKEAIKELKPRDKARQWLMATLASGPMLAESVKEAAKAAGISGRTLRRSFEGGNFRHIKNADGRSVWSQPQAGQS